MQPDADHAELMALALKHAIQGRDVAHLVFPDEVQVHPARESAVAGPRAAWRTGHRTAAAALGRRRRADRAARGGR